MWRFSTVPGRKKKTGRSFFPNKPLLFYQIFFPIKQLGCFHKSRIDIRDEGYPDTCRRMQEAQTVSPEHQSFKSGLLFPDAIPWVVSVRNITKDGMAYPG